MDVFERDIFYGTKLHPSKAEYANADGSSITTAGAEIQSSGLRKTLKNLSDQEQEKRAKAQGGTARSKILGAGDQVSATQTQTIAPVSETPAPAPVPTSQGPFLGTFQFPQQGYDDGTQQSGGGVSNQTLIFIAVGIAAVGMFLYLRKPKS